MFTVVSCTLHLTGSCTHYIVFYEVLWSLCNQFYIAVTGKRCVHEDFKVMPYKLTYMLSAGANFGESGESGTEPIGFRLCIVHVLQSSMNAASHWKQQQHDFQNIMQAPSEVVSCQLTGNIAM